MSTAEYICKQQVRSAPTRWEWNEQTCVDREAEQRIEELEAQATQLQASIDELRRTGGGGNNAYIAELLAQNSSLMNQLGNARSSGDTALIAQLLEQIRKLMEEVNKARNGTSTAPTIIINTGGGSGGGGADNGTSTVGSSTDVAVANTLASAAAETEPTQAKTTKKTTKAKAKKAAPRGVAYDNAPVQDQESAAAQASGSQPQEQGWASDDEESPPQTASANSKADSYNGATRSNSAANTGVHGAYIQGTTGPGILLYPILIAGANGAYYLIRKKK